MRRLRVALALIRCGDRYLVARREEGVHLGGCWEFPGGKLEPGEEPAEGAVREAREELAVACCAVSCLPPIEFAYPDRTVILHPVECRIEAGEPDPAREWRWLLPDEMDPADFPPANVDLIRRLRSGSSPSST